MLISLSLGNSCLPFGDIGISEVLLLCCLTAEIVEMNMWSGGEKILPLSCEEACNWSEEFFPADKYESIFGYMEDDLDHTNGAVIMNPYTWGTNSRYGTYGISTIQSDDRAGANALY